MQNLGVKASYLNAVLAGLGYEVGANANPVKNPIAPLGVWA